MTGARGGRPRDPELDSRIIAASIVLLAERGMPGFTGDAVAEQARVGKASIFRRWPSMHALLADVVLQLGVRPVEQVLDLEQPGTLRQDLVFVLHAATTGPAAAAERAVLADVARTADLRAAYSAGPALRLARALEVVEQRGCRRGEPSWPSMDPVFAAHALLTYESLVDDLAPPDLDEVDRVVDAVVLPGLLDYRTETPA